MKPVILRELGSMEPLLPDLEMDRLAELSRTVFVETGALGAMVPAEPTRLELARLLREMNSYYSNLIEGHKTLPRDIERALNNQLSTDERKRHNQCLSAAHVRVETAMEERLRQEPELNIHSADFLCWLHRMFYQGLPEELQSSRTVSGKSYRIEPGELRAFDVRIAGHTPPEHGHVPAFLARFAQFYGSRTILPTQSLVAAASAHHRLTWIHPFGDGNGRVARLYSHAYLIREKVDGLGLWTLSRGLARFRDRYYERLAAADGPRRNDLDGRGSLTARGLADFCLFFLDVMQDQIRFMTGLLELPKLLERVERHTERDSPHITRHKTPLIRLLKAVIVEGLIERGRVSEIVGLRTSAARQVTRLALEEGLAQSATPKGPLGIAFPAKVLDAYFPRLFLDLPLAE